MNVYNFPLLDGPLSNPIPSKEKNIAEMAAILVSADAYQTEAGAIQVLMDTRAYRRFEIYAYVEQARHTAMQEIVSREMSAS